MNMKKLGIKLKELDTTFKYVNWGGCGCVAAMLAKAFRHQFPIMRITSSGTFGPTDLDKIRETMNNNMSKDDWYNNGIHFNHVWVEVFFNKRWYVLDATGIHTRKEMYARWSKPATGSFSIDEMEALASESSWNTSFDREQLPAMQRMIDTMLPV